MKPTDDVSQFPENGMSTTPRTDAAYFKQGATMYDLAGESKKLETELAAMTARAELAEASAKLWEADALRYANNTEFWQARAEKAEADTARMDWLEKESPEDWGIRSITRDAIDAAMKEASQ